MLSNIRLHVQQCCSSFANQVESETESLTYGFRLSEGVVHVVTLEKISGLLLSIRFSSNKISCLFLD
jgi:hypothetical protein